MSLDLRLIQPQAYSVSVSASQSFSLHLHPCQTYAQELDLTVANKKNNHSGKKPFLPNIQRTKSQSQHVSTINYNLPKLAVFATAAARKSWLFIRKQISNTVELFLYQLHFSIPSVLNKPAPKLAPLPMPGRWTSKLNRWECTVDRDNPVGILFSSYLCWEWSHIPYLLTRYGYGLVF